jgi:TonB-dependent SusC/RagA subfamily outer membrane receptor
MHDSRYSYKILIYNKMNKILFFLIFLPLFFFTTVNGQKNSRKIVITGLVTDAKQNPVEGAAVFIDKKHTSAVTGKDGRYKVKARPAANMISVASASFGVSEAVIEGRKEINFVFTGPALTGGDESKKGGKEESVNIGYGTQNKKDMGMTINQVDARKSKFSSYSDIYSMIKGEVPGVSVRGKSIIMRGSNSVNTTSEALLIVDGIKVSSIENIAPQMVKSIEVLKGPAAAIYGSRGTNGVVLITLIR